MQLGKCYASLKDAEEALTLGRNSCSNGEQTRWPTAHRAGNRPGCSTEVPLRDRHILNRSSHMAGCLLEALIQTFWQVHMVWQSCFEASSIHCRNLIFYRSLNVLYVFKFSSLNKVWKTFHGSEKLLHVSSNIFLNHLTISVIWLCFVEVIANFEIGHNTRMVTIVFKCISF